jgi:hypothetical protein
MAGIGRNKAPSWCAGSAATTLSVALLLATTWSQARQSFASVLAHGAAIVACGIALIASLALSATGRRRHAARRSLVVLLIGWALYLPARQLGIYLLRVELLSRIDQYEQLLPNPGVEGLSQDLDAAGVAYVQPGDGYVVFGIKDRGRTAVLHVTEPHMVANGRYRDRCVRDLRPPWYLLEPCPGQAP